MTLIAPTAVGQQLQPGRTLWDEGLNMMLVPEGVQLFWFRARIDSSLAGGFTMGTTHYGWVPSGSVALLMARLTDRTGAECIGWHDVAYTVRADQQTGVVPLSAAPGTGRPVPASVALVDADGGMIHAVRQETWPPHVADAIGTVVQAYQDLPPEPAQEYRQLTELLTELRAEDEPAARASSTTSMLGARSGTQRGTNWTIEPAPVA